MSIVYHEVSIEKGRAIDMPAALEKFEKDMLVEALKQCSGVKAHAALLLGINRTTLLEKMKKYELPLGAQTTPQLSLRLRKDV